MQNLKTILFIVILSSSFALVNAQGALQKGTFYSSEFIIDDLHRSFSFYIPTSYSTEKNADCIVFFHDENETSKQLLKDYSEALTTEADKKNIVLIFPDAYGKHWHQGTKTTATKDSINDIGFISILTDYFINQYYCNSNKIFLCGINNGADIATATFCTLPSKINSIATIYTKTSHRSICNISSNEKVRSLTLSSLNKTEVRNFLQESSSYFSSLKED